MSSPRNGDRGEDDARPRIEVWQEPQGEWQWRYLGVAQEEGEPLELMANEPETSKEEAVEAATLSYPGVPVHVRETRRPPVPEDPHQWQWTALTAALALGLAAAAVRYRRWWAAPFAPLLAHRVVTGVRRRVP